jgi:hypothetical protein
MTWARQNEHTDEAVIYQDGLASDTGCLNSSDKEHDMRTLRLLTRHVFHAIFTCAIMLPAALLAADPASGRPLTWQFKPGQALRWTLDQAVVMKAPQFGKVVEANLRNTIDFDVNVTAVDQGVATLQISTARIRAEMDHPDGKMSYDSAPEKARAGEKKTDKDDPDDDEGDSDAGKIGQQLFAGLLAPMRELRFSVLVDQLCSVQEIKIDEKQLQPFKTSGPLQSFMILFDKDGFSSAYLGGFVKMPTDVAAEKSWTSKVESSGSGLLGKASFEHELRRDNTARVEGQDLEKISATVQMAFDNELGLFELGEQKGTGALYFDANRGRLNRSEWSLTAKLLFGGGKAEGELKMTTKSQIRERDAGRKN